MKKPPTPLARVGRYVKNASVSRLSMSLQGTQRRGDGNGKKARTNSDGVPTMDSRIDERTAGRERRGATLRGSSFVLSYLVIIERISAMGLRHSRYHALKSVSMPSRAKM